MGPTSKSILISRNEELKFQVQSTNRSKCLEICIQARLYRDIGRQILQILFVDTSDHKNVYFLNYNCYLLQGSTIIFFATNAIYCPTTQKKCIHTYVCSSIAIAEQHTTSLQWKKRRFSPSCHCSYLRGEICIWRFSKDFKMSCRERHR